MEIRLLRLWLAFTIVAGGTVDALAHDETESPIEHRLNLLEMAGIPGPGRINVGLDWKYQSAVATHFMRSPKIAVGNSPTIAAALHVSSHESNATALFTGDGRVGVQLHSPSLGATLGLSTGKGNWELSAKNEQELTVSRAGEAATLRLVNGRVGINTDVVPVKSLHVQSSTKGDGLLFQGNVNGNTSAMMDAMLTLEASNDKRGRGLFLPHRDRAEGAVANAWFAGVPAGGVGFTIGSSVTHVEESQDGPYAKSKSRVFITPEGAVGLGTATPEGRLHVQVPGDSKLADKAVNVKGGSISVDFGRGINTAGVGLISGDVNTVIVGSSHKDQGRDIRLQTNTNSYVVVTKANGWVGVGGVTAPESPLHVKGDISVGQGTIKVSANPAKDQKMLSLNSGATAPAALGFKQGDKLYMSVSAGSKGGSIEMNKADLSIMGGKVGFGVKPTELLHVHGGNVLLDGDAALNLGDSTAGSKIWEDAGLHMASQKGRVLIDNSELFVSNKESSSAIRIKSEAANKAQLQLVSGEASWVMHTSGATDGALLFGQDKDLLSLTKQGQLGIGIDKPESKLHVQGSAILQEQNAAVYTTMLAKSESSQAGVKLLSGKTQWRIEARGAPAGSVGAGSLQFLSMDRTHMVISKVGGVGIGVDTPLPGTVLHVKGPTVFEIGKEKGRIVLSTPNGSPGLSFFNNAGARIADLETTQSGLSLMRTGRIGLGTREPVSRLHVHDVDNSAITLSRSDKATALGILSYNGPFMQLGSNVKDGVQFVTESTPQVTLHPNGKFGIHTVAPVSELQINTRSHVFQMADATHFTGNAFHDGTSFRYTSNGAAAGVKLFANGGIGLLTAAQGNAQQTVKSFETPRLFVTQQGDVGIGTEAPDASFHVASTSKVTLQSQGAMMLGSSTSTENMVLDSNTLQARNSAQGSNLHLNPFGGDVSLFSGATDASTQAIFTSKGQVGFGITDPVAKLHVSEGTDKFTTIAVGDSPKGAGVIRYKGTMLSVGFAKTAIATTNQEDAIVVKPDGNVGIGTTTPDSALSVKGDMSVSGKLKVGGKEIGALMQQLMEENKLLRAELAETKEMMLDMSSNMRRMNQMQARDKSEQSS